MVQKMLIQEAPMAIVLRLTFKCWTPAKFDTLFRVRTSPLNVALEYDFFLKVKTTN